LIFGFILSTAAIAQLPLEEIWRVEMDSASALGNAWVDEDGNHNVLVGDGWQAKLISNEEVIWTSDSLIGPVTALIRIPYSDGEQIVVAASEPIPGPDDDEPDSTLFGHLYRFGGDEFEQLSDQRLLDYFYNIDLIIDERNVTKLAVLPEMIEAEGHPVIAAWKTTTWSFFGVDLSSGRIGVITDDSFECISVGVPVGVEIFRDSDNRTRIALGWHRWYDERGGGGEYNCNLTLFDADLSTVNSVTLAEHSFMPAQGPWSPPDRRPELLGMKVVVLGDGPSLFVANSDTSHAFLCEMSVSDLDVIQTRALPDDWRSGQMLSFQWEREDLSISILLLIDSQGSVLVFDAETLVQIGDGALPQPYVGSLQTDFDGDGDPELVTLARNRLVCYSIAPLTTPHDHFIPHPSSFILIDPYPNPFNNVVTIRYAVPELANVRIVLFDILGRKVQELTNKQHKPGIHRIRISGVSLNSGVYYCKMQSSNFEQTEKLIYLK